MPRGPKFQIFDAIVGAIAVLVVNSFVSRKFSAEVFFHHLPMLKDKYPLPSIASVLNTVAVLIEAPPFRLSSLCTLAGTESLGTVTDVIATSAIPLVRKLLVALPANRGERQCHLTSHFVPS